MTSAYSPPAVAFQTRLQVRWSDQDLNGHVNNARVITLLEEARIEATRSWSAGSEDHSDLVRVVRSMSVAFHQPVHYIPTLSAYVWVTRIGNTSFTIRHELIQDGALCVAGEAAMVLVDPTTGRPSPPTGSLRADLHKALSHDAKGSL